MEAFQMAKSLFDEAKVVYYDKDAPHEIFVDSSQYAAGGYLSQNEKIVMCTSVAFPDSVQNGYSATERELLGIVSVIRKLDRYLFGRFFKVFTDHKALVRIFIKREFATRRLANLVMKLNEYEFEVIYIPGKDHVLADALSRVRTVNALLRLVDLDEAFELWKIAHGSLHHNVRTTMQKLKGVYWKGKSRDVLSWNRGCVCSFKKEDRRVQSRVRYVLDLGRYPLHVVALDIYLFSKAPYLTALDLYSDHFWAIRTKNKSAVEVERGFKRLVDLMTGYPDEVLTDRGQEFNWLKTYDIKHRRTASYRPESNSRLERKHRELGKACRIQGVTPDRVELNDDHIKALFDEPIPESKDVKLNDLVLRYVNRRAREKHESPWRGPFKISKILGEFTLELEDGAVVNRDDVKLFVEMAKGIEVYLNWDEVKKILKLWNFDEEDVWDVFTKCADPWGTSWANKNVLVRRMNLDVIDLLLKAMGDMCSLILPMPDVRTVEMNVLGSLEAEWVEFESSSELLVLRNGKNLSMRMEHPVWLVCVTREEFEHTLQTWRGDVESWISAVSCSRPTETDGPAWR